MLDPVSRFLDTEDAGNQTEVMRRVLPTTQNPFIPVNWTSGVPALVEYPLEEVIKDQRCAYMNNTTAYALAFAALERGRSHRPVRYGLQLQAQLAFR